MTAPFAARGPEADMPSVTLLPPEEAYDYEFVASRLEDTELLNGSVAVCAFRAPLLAIPVGGRRLGGRMDAGHVSVALAIRNALSGRPGFPRVRIRLVSPPDLPQHWAVEWGEFLQHLGLDSRDGLTEEGFPMKTNTCRHEPACPKADATDRDAALLVAHHPEQGWGLLCNGVLLFEDTGELLPDGRSIEPRRPVAVSA